MKRFALPVVAAGFALSLAACVTPGTSPSSTVEQVQAAAEATCGFLPLAATIIAILNVQNPNITTPLQVGSAICAAVQSAKQRTPVVLGIPVQGRMIANANFK